MTQDLTRTLREHADDVHGRPLTLADVRGRARSIRRRQAASVAGIAAAVVLAVSLPTLMVARHHDGARAPEPAPSPTAPGAAVMHDGIVTRADGTTVDLGVDNELVSQMGVLSDGRILLGMMQPYGIQVYSADGSQHHEVPAASNSFTMSADDSVAAWAAGQDTVRILASGTAEASIVAAPGVGSVDAVLDAGHVLIGDSPTTWAVATPDGMTEIEPSEALRVIDVSPDGDLWAVSFVPDAEHEDGGCAGLYDPATDRVVARDCSAYDLSFAPDGKHVLSEYHENNMVGSVRVLDLGLRPVLQFEPSGDDAVVASLAWADADHLLAGIAQGQSWTLQRFGLDGTEPTVVAGPVDGHSPEAVDEYLLSE